MKKLFCVLISISLVICCGFTASAQSESKGDLSEISASAYVLYCPQDGSIILSKNENERRKPASTTKLMTALLTLEQAEKCDSTVTFTEAMAAEGSSMYLGYGDRLKLSDLAVGMMMCSGNDAANAAAITISGSKERFSELMNSRARSIGMSSTHFVTPSGLDDDDHYSTAYDMALLMTEVLKDQELAELISQKSASVDFISPDKHMTYTNHNKLLSLYDGCIGGKTGYTTAAGRCLVTAARRGDLTLICVTLDDKNDWNDHIAMYDYGFSRFGCLKYGGDFSAKVPVAGGEDEYVDVRGEKGFELVLPKAELDGVKRKIRLDSFLFAPVKEGAAVGRLEYILDGETLRSVPLTAQNGTEYKRIKKDPFEWIKELFTNG